MDERIKILDNGLAYYRHREVNRRRYKYYNRHPEWAQTIYEREMTFPDTGIYIMYFDEFGAQGIGLPYSAYKIGLSDRISKRRATLQTGTPIPLKPIHVIESSDLIWCETWLHNALRERRIDSDLEWFALSYKDITILLDISVLNKPKTTQEQRRMLDIYEQFNPSDYEAQLDLFNDE